MEVDAFADLRSLHLEAHHLLKVSGRRHGVAGPKISTERAQYRPPSSSSSFSTVGPNISLTAHFSRRRSIRKHPDDDLRLGPDIHPSIGPPVAAFAHFWRLRGAQSGRDVLRDSG